MQTHRRTLCLTMAAATAILGYTCRFIHLGLPASIVKYGGSALWAVMIYWLLAIAFPSFSVRSLTIITTLIASAIEFLKLLQTPALQAFRLTFAGKVLLGRIFSPRDLAAYYVAIALTAWLDHTNLQTNTK